MALARIEEHSFLTDELSPMSWVIDLGANAGRFSTEVISRWGCQVLAVEPVPDLFAALPRNDRLTADQRAISDTAVVRLHLNRFACASTVEALGEGGAGAVDVTGTTLARLLEEHDITDVALLKVDIEGAELDMLENAPPEVLLLCHQITVEFHDFLDPTMTTRVDTVRDRLGRIGFREIRFSRDNSDVLFVAPGFPLSGRRALWLRGPVKYRNGCGRLIRRRLSRSN